MRIKEIKVSRGVASRAEWSPRDAVLHVVAGKDGPEALADAVAECVIDAVRTEQPLFIGMKEASALLNMCAPKLQGYARTHYKGCPAVLEGNKYLFNARLLPAWVDRLTQDAIENT